MDEHLDFASLISPLEVDQFFDQYWEQRPLHHRAADGNQMSGLLAAHDVESIALAGLRLADRPDAVLAGRCSDGEAQYWPIPRDAGPNKAIYSLLHAFAAGYSIVVNAVDTFWAPVAALTRQFESCLQHPVGATMYYSPRNSQGFPAHFDKHDVIALQISGEKTWDLYQPVHSTLCGDADPWTVPSPLGSPSMRACLGAGDLLYLPRGWTHRVHTGDGASLHLTMGIKALRWADLVLLAAERAVRSDPRLQEAIPLHRSLTSTEINSSVAAMVANLTMPDGTNPHQALMTEVLDGRPTSLGGQIQEILAADKVIAPSTVLRRRPGLRPIITQSADEVTLRFAGNGLSAAPSFLPALELIANQATTTVAQLSTAILGDAEPLARALIINGLLIPATEAH